MLRINKSLLFFILKRMVNLKLFDRFSDLIIIKSSHKLSLFKKFQILLLMIFNALAIKS